jgi:hypothetical protein
MWSCLCYLGEGDFRCSYVLTDSVISLVLPPFQIVGHFGFNKCIVFAMRHIMYA